MRSRWVVLALIVSSFAASHSFGAASSVAREEKLPRVCKRGPLEGTPCTDGTECGGVPCVVDFLPRTSFSGELTLIVDDNVSKFDGSETVSDVVAVTVLLEVPKLELPGLEVPKVERQLHAQIYQNLDGDSLESLIASLQTGPEVASNVGQGRPLDEAKLSQEAADPAELIDAFLFQTGDTELADALRGQFGTTGVPIIVGVSRVEYSDRTADGMASVARMRVKGTFLAP